MITSAILVTSCFILRSNLLFRSEQPTARVLRAMRRSLRRRCREEGHIPYVPNPHVQKDKRLTCICPKDKGVGPVPLVVWMHGGAFKYTNKDWNNVKYLVKHGYALASVDYRLTDDAKFPAQIQDSNVALEFSPGQCCTRMGLIPGVSSLAVRPPALILPCFSGWREMNERLTLTRLSNRSPSSISSGQPILPASSTKWARGMAVRSRKML